MIPTRYLPILAVALVILGCSSIDTDPASPNHNQQTLGLSLLQDDFSTGSIDSTHWNTFTNIPSGNASVLVDGGHAVLINRGYLTTSAQFSPRTLNGIRITGEWRIGSAPDDFLQIITRTMGSPDPSNPFGEVAHGIEFIAMGAAVFESPNRVDISGRGRAANAVTHISSSGNISLVPGRTYRFEVVDQGQRLSFTITDVAVPSQTRTVVATSPYPGDFHFVAFHNRERCCGGDHRSRLDNILIEGNIN